MHINWSVYNVISTKNIAMKESGVVGKWACDSIVLEHMYMYVYMYMILKYKFESYLKYLKHY